MLDKKKFYAKVKGTMGFWFGDENVSVQDSALCRASIVENDITEAYNDGFEDGVKHASEHQIAPTCY